MSSYPVPYRPAHAGLPDSSRAVRTQIDKEIAMINAITQACAATEQLPDDLPAAGRRLTDRIALATARFAERLAR